MSALLGETAAKRRDDGIEKKTQDDRSVSTYAFIVNNLNELINYSNLFVNILLLIYAFTLHYTSPKNI